MRRAAGLVLLLACLVLSLYVLAGKVRDGEAFAVSWGPSEAELDDAARAHADWKLDSAGGVLDGIHRYVGSYHGTEQIEWQEEYRLAYVGEDSYCLEVRVCGGVYHRWGPGDETEPGGC